MLEIVKDAPLEKGTLLVSRYRLDHIVGEGGMGIVWSALDLERHEPVAIKLLRAEAGERGRYVHRLMREARVMAQLVHPSIAKVHGAFETPAGMPFLVMDLLHGEALSARLSRGALSFQETSKLLSQVTSAIAAAHAAGVVHRDLKPENIYVEAGDVVRVLDFGIAKVTNLPAEELSLTATGAMLGTPYYMAPEQIFGDDDIDARADIWALGVVLYECVAGVRPTQASGVGQVIKIIMNDAIVPLERRVAVPENVARLVGRMLTRDRAARPTLDEVSECIEAMANLPQSQQRIAASAATAMTTLDSMEVGTPQRVVSPAPDRAKPRPYKSLLGLGLVATIAIIAQQTHSGRSVGRASEGPTVAAEPSHELAVVTASATTPSTPSTAMPTGPTMASATSLPTASPVRLRVTTPKLAPSVTSNPTVPKSVDSVARIPSFERI